jgi:hypothetical protein
MFCQAGFDQWQTTIMHHLSPLSKPQAPVLARWEDGYKDPWLSLTDLPPEASEHSRNARRTVLVSRI